MPGHVTSRTQKQALKAVCLDPPVSHVRHTWQLNTCASVVCHFNLPGRVSKYVQFLKNIGDRWGHGGLRHHVYPLGGTFQCQKNGYHRRNTFSFFSLPEFLLMLSADCQPSTGLLIIWSGEKEFVWFFFHLLSKLEGCNMSLSVFKLSIPNDFSIFISLGNRGWLGPESHQGLNAFRNLKEEGVRLTVCEGAALGRVAPTVGHFMTWTHPRILMPSVEAGPQTHDKSTLKHCIKIYTYANF